MSNYDLYRRSKSDRRYRSKFDTDKVSLYYVFGVVQYIYIEEQLDNSFKIILDTMLPYRV